VRRYYNLAYFLFWLKISELIETVIFVLRKKQNQVSKLHIFHHFSTVTLVYALINFNENGKLAGCWVTDYFHKCVQLYRFCCLLLRVLEFYRSRYHVLVLLCGGSGG